MDKPMDQEGQRMSISIRTLAGAEMARHLDALAHLRISVFAAWPYLYDGDAAYEADYLREFAAGPGSVLVGAFAGNELVGAATASPMNAQKRDICGPLEEHGFRTAAMFYFGESVLLPQWRGQGIGHAFFNHREAAARAAGAAHAAFAAVDRPADHPARPADYRPLDEFWTRRGYRKLPGVQARMRWKDHGEAAESEKTLTFWIGLLPQPVVPMN